MKGLHKCGVHELTRLEQREILGGEGFWRTVGHLAGTAFANLLDWLDESANETWLRQTGDWREDAV